MSERQEKWAREKVLQLSECFQEIARSERYTWTRALREMGDIFDRLMSEHSGSASLDRKVWKATLSWWDIVSQLGGLEEFFMSLPEVKKADLMNKYELELGKYLDEGFMYECGDVIDVAISNSGLIEELEAMKNDLR